MFLLMYDSAPLRERVMMAAVPKYEDVRTDADKRRWFLSNFPRVTRNVPKADRESCLTQLILKGPQLGTPDAVARAWLRTVARNDSIDRSRREQKAVLHADRKTPDWLGWRVAGGRLQVEVAGSATVALYEVVMRIWSGGGLATLTITRPLAGPAPFQVKVSGVKDPVPFGKVPPPQITMAVGGTASVRAVEGLIRSPDGVDIAWPPRSSLHVEVVGEAVEFSAERPRVSSYVESELEQHAGATPDTRRGRRRPRRRAWLDLGDPAEVWDRLESSGPAQRLATAYAELSPEQRALLKEGRGEPLEALRLKLLKAMGTSGITLADLGMDVLPAPIRMVAARKVEAMVRRTVLSYLQAPDSRASAIAVRWLDGDLDGYHALQLRSRTAALMLSHRDMPEGHRWVAHPAPARFASSDAPGDKGRRWNHAVVGAILFRLDPTRRAAAYADAVAPGRGGLALADDVDALALEVAESFFAHHLGVQS